MEYEYLDNDYEIDRFEKDGIEWEIIIHKKIKELKNGQKRNREQFYTLFKMSALSIAWSL